MAWTTRHGIHVGSDKNSLNKTESIQMACLAQALTESKRGEWIEDDNADLSRSFHYKKHRRPNSRRSHVAIGPVRVTPRQAKAMFKHLHSIQFSSNSYEKLFAMIEVKTGKIVNKAFMTLAESFKRNAPIKSLGYQWKSIVYNGEDAKLYGGR